MADFNTMGAYLTVILITMNVAILVFDVSAGSELIPESASTIIQASNDQNKLTEFLPGGVNFGATDRNQMFTTSDLQPVQLNDQNVVLSGSGATLESFLGPISGLINTAFTSGGGIVNLAMRMLFGYVLIVMVLQFPAEFIPLVAVILVPIVLLQLYYVWSVLGAIVGVLRR